MFTSHFGIATFFKELVYRIKKNNCGSQQTGCFCLLFATNSSIM